MLITRKILECILGTPSLAQRILELLLNKYMNFLVIDREALAKQGDNALGSIRPSVRLSVRPFVCLLACQHSHYQSKVFVCVSIIMGRILIIARMRSIGF